MRAVSLFSGVGGFELGLERAGIHTVLQAEIDPWCQSVLARHWPEVERVDDVREVGARWARADGRIGKPAGGDAPDGAGVLSDQRRGQARPGLSRGADPGAVGAGGDVAADGATDAARAGGGVDLVYGGFPCQDVSVAGARAGFGGERSVLWFEFERVLRELRPRWALAENVPGLLSSGPEPGADFGVVLRGLVDLGYGVAWRVVDAKWFGVPQRRRRVFIVGCLGDARRAAQVLAVCESCGGHSAPRPEAGQGAAYALNASVRGTGDGHGNAWNSNYVADPEAWSTKIANTTSNQAGKFYEEYTPALAEDSPVPAVAYTLPSEHRGIGNAWNHNYLPDNMGTLDASYGRLQGASNQHVDSGQLVVASTLSAGAHPESNLPGRHHEDDENLVVEPEVTAFDWQASAGNDESWRGKGRQHVVRSGDYAGAVSATRTDAVFGSAVDEGNARPLVARASGYRMDMESETFVVGTTFNGGDVGEQAPSLVSGDGPHRRSTHNGMDVVVASPDRASDGHHGYSSGRGDGADNLIANPIGTREGKTYTHEGANNFRTHNLVEAFSRTESWGSGEGGDVSPPTRSAGHGASNNPAIAYAGGVRRLTPLECERLMGFPDDWTKYTADGKEIPDSHRYRMCGNGVVAPCAEWLGHRLVEVDSW